MTRNVMGLIAVLYSAGIARGDDFIVYSPYVIESQNEVEVRGYRYGDARTELNGSSAEMSISRGVNGWWKPELYLAKYQRSAALRGQLQGYEVENTFQLSPPGKYWADFGLLASYERNTRAGSPDACEFGPLFASTTGRWVHLANAVWEKQVGAGSTRHYEVRYAYSVTYAATQSVRPGLEAYARPADRAYQAGPVLTGEFHLPGSTSNFDYRAGVVVGLNAAAPRQTWLARLEYEFL